MSYMVLNVPSQKIETAHFFEKFDMFFTGKEMYLDILAVDNSKWNLLEGNKRKQSIRLYIDSKRPKIKVINNSYSIRYGGSAVAIVKVAMKIFKRNIFYSIIRLNFH